MLNEKKKINLIYNILELECVWLKRKQNNDVNDNII